MKRIWYPTLRISDSYTISVLGHPCNYFIKLIRYETIFELTNCQLWKPWQRILVSPINKDRYIIIKLDEAQDLWVTQQFYDYDFLLKNVQNYLEYKNYNS